MTGYGKTQQSHLCIPGHVGVNEKNVEIVGRVVGRNFSVFVKQNIAVSGDSVIDTARSPVDQLLSTESPLIHGFLITGTAKSVSGKID